MLEVKSLQTFSFKVKGVPYDFNSTAATREEGAKDIHRDLTFCLAELAREFPKCTEQP